MGSWGSLLMIAALFVMLYFFMIRPQKKQEKKDAEMRNALQVGDEVTTIGGIIGKVVSVKGETFVLETTRDRTRIRFLVTAIRSVDVKAEEAGAVRTRATAAPKKDAEDVIDAVAEDAATEEAVTEEVATEEVAAEETDSKKDDNA